MAMIEFKTGDILRADVEALVNTVNCVGIMGRGLALQFKNAFPENFKAYEAACARKEVRPGKMFVFETRTLTNPEFIINFPTKRHWKGKSRMEDIDSGLRALVEEIRTRGIRSIAIPPLGSGLGGLDWADVRPRIVEALRGLKDIQVIVYEPNSKEEGKAQMSDEKMAEPLPVKGYTPQPQWKIDAVNANKVLEEAVLRVIDELSTIPDTDKRFLALGRTRTQEAFMAINRAIFQPERVEGEIDPSAAFEAARRAAGRGLGL